MGLWVLHFVFLVSYQFPTFLTLYSPGVPGGGLRTLFRRFLSNFWVVWPFRDVREGRTFKMLSHNSSFVNRIKGLNSYQCVWFTLSTSFTTNYTHTTSEKKLGLGWGTGRSPGSRRGGRFVPKKTHTLFLSHTFLLFVFSAGQFLIRLFITYCRLGMGVFMVFLDLCPWVCLWTCVYKYRRDRYYRFLFFVGFSGRCLLTYLFDTIKCMAPYNKSVVFLPSRLCTTYSEFL